MKDGPDRIFPIYKGGGLGNSRPATKKTRPTENQAAKNQATPGKNQARPRPGFFWPGLAWTFSLHEWKNQAAKKPGQAEKTRPRKNQARPKKPGQAAWELSGHPPPLYMDEIKNIKSSNGRVSYSRDLIKCYPDSYE